MWIYYRQHCSFLDQTNTFCITKQLQFINIYPSERALIFTQGFRTFLFLFKFTKTKWKQMFTHLNMMYSQIPYNTTKIYIKRLKWNHQTETQRTCQIFTDHRFGVTARPLLWSNIKVHLMNNFKIMNHIKLLCCFLWGSGDTVFKWV